jgi:hypothetical protein
VFTAERRAPVSIYCESQRFLIDQVEALVSHPPERLSAGRSQSVRAIIIAGHAPVTAYGVDVDERTLEVRSLER